MQCVVFELQEQLYNVMWEPIVAEGAARRATSTEAIPHELETRAATAGDIPDRLVEQDGDLSALVFACGLIDLDTRVR